MGLLQEHTELPEISITDSLEGLGFECYQKGYRDSWEKPIGDDFLIFVWIFDHNPDPQKRYSFQVSKPRWASDVIYFQTIQEFIEILKNVFNICLC